MFRTVIAGTMLMAAFGILTADAGVERNLAWLQGRCPSGAALAYQYGGSGYTSASDIYVVEIATGTSVKVGRGSQPEFSPDASKLAWIDGTTAKGRMRNQGDTSTHVIATGVTAGGGVHWVSNEEVVVVKSSKWYKIHLNGASAEVPALTALGTGGSETDVKYRGNNAWSYANGTTWKTSEGQSGSTGGSCSPSLSPDGKSVTGLVNGHDECKLTRIITGGVSGTLYRSLADCSDKGFDNHRWSSNAAYVVAQYECQNKIGVWDVSTSDVVLLGNCTGESYGDFTVGSGAGDPWPGTSVTPVMVCDIATQTFDYVIGATAPASQTTQVYTTSGTLEGVSKSSTPSWLSVSLSATSGARITVTNAVSTVGLAIGTYTQTVTITSTNAGSISYTVRLNVTAQAAQPALRMLYPNGGEILTVGQAVTITWAANEDSITRVNVELSPDNGENWFPISSSSVNAGEAGWEAFPWTVAGGAFVSEHVLVRVRDYNEGSGIVDASDGVLAIREQGAIALKYNCGTSLLAVAGWADPAAFATGGVDYDFGQAISTTGVANAAPADVYRTCRHRRSGVETGFSFTFASIPDGYYTVRLHFADGNSERAIDVAIEGQPAVTDLNISSQAGGAYKALVIERQVQVSDGNGMTIALDDNRSTPADVLISGIEILSGSASTANPRTARAVATGAHVVVEPGRICVLANGNPSFMTAVLRDISGRVAARAQMDAGGLLTLTTRGLSRGLYQLSVTTAAGNSVYPVTLCR